MRKCEELPVIDGVHECKRCNAYWKEAEEFPNWKPFECPERSGWCWNYPLPSSEKIGDVVRAMDGTVFATVAVGEEGYWGMELQDLPVKGVGQ